VSSVAAAKKDGKVVIAQIAPAVRVAIAETMGLPPGAVTIGQMVTGLRQIGFDYVFGELLTQLLAVVSIAENCLQRLCHLL
jgi:NADH-quinone oxidoreductase subunit G